MRVVLVGRGPAGRDVKLLVLLTHDTSHVLVRGQLAYLADKGFDVHVGVRRSALAAESDPFDEAATVHQIPFERQPSLLRDLFALAATIKLIRRLRPTVVNASTPKAGVIGMLAAWVCRVPVRVYVLRGLRSETLGGVKGAIARWLERVPALAAHCVLVNSESLLDLAISRTQFPSAKTRVLGNGSGNGIDLERFSPQKLPPPNVARRLFGLGEDSLVVGFIGRLTADKGVGDLLRAFQSLKGDSLELLLVGPIEKGDPIDTIHRDLISADDRIAHVPWLDDARDALAAIDVLAFPSYREGLPNVPLEAQACGVPVVAYAATGTVDAVGEGISGILVPTGDFSSLSAAIQGLVDDPVRRRSLADSGPAWVASKFDQQRIWSELESCYQELMGRLEKRA